MDANQGGNSQNVVKQWLALSQTGVKGYHSARFMHLRSNVHNKLRYLSLGIMELKLRQMID
jgi:hypothetical protein